MKKLTPILAIVGVIAIISLALFGFSQLNNPVSDVVGGWADSRIIEDGTHVTTSTTALPVKLLDRDGSRQYAIFQNVSATAVYLYFSGTALEHGVEGSASSTIGLDGIYLAASGGKYELLNDNLIIDEVWATSTAASLDINVYYK